MLAASFTAPELLSAVSDAGFPVVHMQIDLLEIGMISMLFGTVILERSHRAWLKISI
jgi:hypothetical protein